MSLTTSIIVLIAISVAIYVIIEVRRFKHKLFAIFLILMLVLSYASFAFVFRGKDVDYTSMDGLTNAGKIYLSWLGSVFHNVRIITSNVINLDWNFKNETNSDTLNSISDVNIG